MKGVLALAGAVSIALMRVAGAAYTTEMALCTDMCPTSTLVADDGAGISRCFDACKRLIHRVKYGDVLDNLKIDDHVSAPKDSPLKRIRKVLAKKKTGGSTSSAGSSGSESDS
ncbi:hypothetical protein BBBOND_0210930 [Babesia bigemina]|uniref:Secreted protein n=1 Tax=Babesia bigemina TaxID=5866 RepID=A0A061DD46_BABBI|nr:hypothetical protein BBBOND_0210930 [Babesia bigemina]CDR95945.1 hypothetical protein BBBOND_0210930 [Babesia bigemina]|eukprot:XP_012768131.1 hypothetical protein BBBOND_0210930 [Babesia bigemina]